MAQTIEQKIVDAVLQNLRAINKKNGYSFNIVAEQVKDWAEVAFEQKNLPAIDVRDFSNEIDEADEDLHNYRFEVTLFVAGEDAPNDVRAKAQDVITAFGKIETNAEVEGAIFLSASKDVDEASRKLMSVTMQFQIDYRSYKWEI